MRLNGAEQSEGEKTGEMGHREKGRSGSVVVFGTPVPWRSSVVPNAPAALTAPVAAAR